MHGSLASGTLRRTPHRCRKRWRVAHGVCMRISLLFDVLRQDDPMLVVATLRSRAACAVAAGVLSTALVGCGQKPPNEYGSPEDAVLAYFNALSSASWEPDRAWAFLTDDTRSELEARAESARSEGVEIAHPVAMLVAFGVPDHAMVESVTREHIDSRSASMTVRTVHGQEFELALERTESLWRVSVPAP